MNVCMNLVTNIMAQNVDIYVCIISICMYVCMYVCMFVCSCTYIYIDMCVCVCIYVHTHTYVNVYIMYTVASNSRTLSLNIYLRCCLYSSIAILHSIAMYVHIVCTNMSHVSPHIAPSAFLYTRWIRAAAHPDLVR
jgi:hypothetical protein